MNQSTEASESGIGGWMDAITYMAGLSGGSWATATYIANGGQLPNDMVDNVSPPFPRFLFPFLRLFPTSPGIASDQARSYGTYSPTSSSQTMVNSHSTPTSSLKSGPRKMPASTPSS